MRSDRSAAWAIFGVFFFESSVIGQWIPRIPDIKESLSLSDGQLGLALLSMPLGTLLGFTIAGRVIHTTGLRNACRIFLPVWALLFILPGMAQDLHQLMLALLLSGLAIGMIETAMNTEAARIENAAGKRLMSRCHGFWSLGTMLGALMGGFIAHQGVGVATHFLLVMPLIAIAGYAVATMLPVMSRTEQLKSTEGAALDSPGTGTVHLIHLQNPRVCLPCLTRQFYCSASCPWASIWSKARLSIGPRYSCVKSWQPVRY